MGETIPQDVRRDVLDRLRTADRILAAAAKLLEAGDYLDEDYNAPAQTESYYADAEVGKAHPEFRQAAGLLGATPSDKRSGLRRYGNATRPYSFAGRHDDVASADFSAAAHPTALA